MAICTAENTRGDSRDRGGRGLFVQKNFARRRRAEKKNLRRHDEGH